MDKYLKQSRLIKNEANNLIENFNLVSIISQYGDLYYTGSYELDLMYKKDIDISIVNNNISVEEFSQLGKDLIDKLNTPSVYYRNTRITPVEKRPENALYWGVKTGEWWIDIWAMSEKVYERSDKYIKEIKGKLTTENRQIVLEIKAKLLKNKTYGVKFGSRELYDAVLNNNVSSVKSFEKYLKEKTHRNEYR